MGPGGGGWANFGGLLQGLQIVSAASSTTAWASRPSAACAVH